MANVSRTPISGSHRQASELRTIIIGAGLAGLFTALKLGPLPVTVIASKPLGRGASSDWAQGGIAAAVGEGDTPEAHAADTIAVGGGLVVPDIAKLLAAEAPERINDLLAFGVPFDRDLEGHLKLSREAAHSARRIVHVRGDMAGRQIMAALIAAASKAPHIHILENLTALETFAENGQVRGVIVARSDEKTRADLANCEFLPASAVILATGGTGRQFAVTTNASDARGEGIGMAARAGAVIADAEFIQFHPTAMDIGKDPAPLATEALRGEGAKLVNRNGEGFMSRVHDLGDLAPRDIVARAVFREAKSDRGAFLDCRGTLGSHMETEFPTVHSFCRDAGLDPATDLIPVVPAAHYHMGGILTDANGRSTVEGLWACGEVASTGAHGANRLASNSLLEAVVFGARIARDIHNITPRRLDLRAKPDTSPGRQTSTGFLNAEDTAAMRQTMSAHVGVERCGDDLALALDTLDEITRRLAASGQTSNMLLAASMITATALARTESRGGHFRIDHEKPVPRLARRSYARLARGEIVLTPLAGNDPAQPSVENTPDSTSTRWSTAAHV